MSVQAITWAWTQQIPCVDKLVLLALADHANDEDSECWPSYQHLARKCGMERRSAIRVIDRLIKIGLVEKVERPYKSCVFRLRVVTHSHQCPKVTGDPESQSSDFDDTPTLLDLNHQKRHMCETPPTTIRTNAKPGVVAETVYSAAFEKFWVAWPALDRKRGKGAAWRCWKQQGCEKVAQRVTDAMLAHSATWGVGYDPLPATYLNQRRFDDPLPQRQQRKVAL